MAVRIFSSTSGSSTIVLDTDTGKRVTKSKNRFEYQVQTSSTPPVYSLYYQDSNRAFTPFKLNITLGDFEQENGDPYGSDNDLQTALDDLVGSEKGGGGAGVQSVSGGIVDNTDPQNPKIPLTAGGIPPLPPTLGTLHYYGDYGDWLFNDGSAWFGGVEDKEGFSNSGLHVNGEYFAYGLIATGGGRGPAYSVDYVIESFNLTNGNAGTTGDIILYLLYPNWNASIDYLTGNKVNYLGTSYLAIQDNNNSQPDISPLDWQVTPTNTLFGDQIVNEPFDLNNGNNISIGGNPQIPRGSVVSIQLNNLDQDFQATSLIIQVRRTYIPFVP